MVRHWRQTIKTDEECDELEAIENRKQCMTAFVVESLRVLLLEFRFNKLHSAWQKAYSAKYA